MDKDCTNCMYEYTCSWEPAGEKGYCEKWKIDIEEEEDTVSKLTEKDDQGNWVLKGVPWENVRQGKVITKETGEKLYGALFKLMQYEDTELSPDKIYELNDLYLEKCQELNKRKWIPVEEALPENPDVMVLVHVSGWPAKNIELVDACELAQYDPEEGWILEMFPEWEDAHPIAWMPLPEPFMISRRQQEVRENYELFR